MGAEADEQDVDRNTRQGLSVRPATLHFNTSANRHKEEKWSPRTLCYEVCPLAS